MNNSEDARRSVAVIDDDGVVRSSLDALLQSVGLPVELFETADEFLQSDGFDRVSCIVTDLRMPGTGGLELQAELRQRRVNAPMIFLSGHGDVSTAVRAMAGGAVGFIEKPPKSQELIEQVRRAIAVAEQRRRRDARRDEVAGRLATLTAREREIFELIVAGRRNQQLAHDLNISVKTVETHRARIMRKMNAETPVDLVRARLIMEDEDPSRLLHDAAN